MDRFLQVDQDEVSFRDWYDQNELEDAVNNEFYPPAICFAVRYKPLPDFEEPNDLEVLEVNMTGTHKPQVSFPITVYSPKGEYMCLWHSTSVCKSFYLDCLLPCVAMWIFVTYHVHGGGRGWCNTNCKLTLIALLTSHVIVVYVCMLGRVYLPWAMIVFPSRPWYDPSVCSWWASQSIGWTLGCFQAK